MMKAILLNLRMAMVALLATFASVQVMAWDFTEENEDGVKIYYSTINSGGNKTCTVGGCDPCETLNIPSTANGLPVIGIEFAAIQHHEELTSVTIPNTVTYIESSAFIGCIGLKEIIIPNSVREISSEVFSYCINLMSVKIPNSVNVIGGRAFYNTALYNDESNWEDGALYIDNCLIEAKGTATGNYDIKEGTRLIAYNAFSSDTYNSITIPESVKSIGYAFNETSLYKDESNWKDGVLYIDNCLIEAKSESSTDLVIEEGTRIIADMAIQRKNITSVHIPNSVKSIGNEAFLSCNKLTSLIIPNSVETIGNKAFYWCDGIKKLVIPNSVKKIGKGAFYCQGLEYILSLIKEPADVELGRLVFPRYNIKEIIVDIPKGCTDKYKDAEQWKDFVFISEIVSTFESNGIFYNEMVSESKQNKAMSTATMPQVMVVNLMDGWYSGVVNIPPTVTYEEIEYEVAGIGYRAFANCPYLTDVTIPSTVMAIGNEAFYGCTGLNSLTIDNNNPNNITMGEDVFAGVDTSACTLIVPLESGKQYETASQWSAFTNIEEKEITGIEATINDNDSTPCYYNLNGTRVQGNSLTRGIYIKVCGKDRRKVIVK